MIAESPDATRATCAWCEQPLPMPRLRPLARVRCSACGAVTTTAAPPWQGDDVPAPPRDAAEARELRGLCSLAEAARRRARRRLAARIARVAPPGAVLDVAPRDHLLLTAVRATGRLATGIARPPSLPGIQDAEITELGGRYAAIVFWQSLGRLPAPGVALDHAAALLKPGGLLTIAQPNAAALQARALSGRWRTRALGSSHVEIPQDALLERLTALGLQVEEVDRVLDPRTVGGRLQHLVGGISSVEARR